MLSVDDNSSLLSRKELRLDTEECSQAHMYTVNVMSQFIFILLYLNKGPACMPAYTNNLDTLTEQPAYLCSLISAFIIHSLESTIANHTTLLNFKIRASLCN